MKRFAVTLLRVFAFATVTGGVLVALAAGAVWLLLPRLEDYKPQVERLVSNYVGQEISIAELGGEWEGLNVILRARGVQVAAGEHPGSQMHFGEMYLSFHPVGLFEPGKTFERLELKGPTIGAARLADGRIRVGDTILGTPRGTLRRLLQGRNLVITDGTFVWRDALAPEEGLQIDDVELHIRSQGERRRFAFTASAPGELVQRLRGNGSYDPATVGAGTWTADVNVSFEQLDLDRIPAAVQEHLPWKSRGRIDSSIHVTWLRGELTMASADLTARDFVIPYARDKTPLAATRFSSSLVWRRSDDEWRLVFLDPEIVLDEKSVSVSRFEVERRDTERIYAARDANVQDLREVIDKLDIELPWKTLIDDLQPRGSFSRATLALTGPYLDARYWRFEGDFRGVGWQAQERYPGVQGLDGRLSADEDGGELALASRDLTVDAAGTLRGPIELDRVEASVEWHRWGGDWVVDVGDGELSNEDLQLTDINLYTRLHEDALTSPYVLARLRVPRADISALRDYLPVNRMTDKQVQWLDQALAGGEISDGRFYLNGALDAFPYDDGRGELKASARVTGGLLNYHEKWPDLDALDGTIELEGARFEARIRGGKLMRSSIDHARVWSDDFFRRDRRLFIQGDLAAQADDVVNFLRRGPLIKEPPPPHRTMAAAGSGTLGLMIELPFTRLKEESRVQGRYVFEDVAVEVADGIEFTELAGTVRFTEETVGGEGVTGSLLGGPVRADVTTVEPGRPMTFAITGTGETEGSRLTPVIGSAMASQLAGSARWKGRFVGGAGINRLDVSSDLNGMEINFPAPLWKASDGSGGIEVHVAFDDDRRRITLDLENRLNGELHYDRESDMSVLQRGVLNLGASRELPDRELAVAVRADDLDMDQWISEINRLRRHQERVETAGSQRDALFDHLRHLAIAAGNVRYLNRELGAVEIRAASGDGRDWTAELAGMRLEGEARVRLDPEPARYELDMDYLHWPRRVEAARASAYEAPPDPSQFAHLSINAGDFRFGDMQFGNLELRAGPQADAWVIRRLTLAQPALDIEAQGRWTADRAGMHRTAVNMTARIPDLGGALTQLGLEDQVAQGKAALDADLSWLGEPGDFSLGGLSGNLAFDAEDGRFLKLDPGSGRLLGLFNVETLARRLKFDFTDVFKKGLAFDRINGEAGITSGRLQTDGIYIIGPATLLELDGSTHLGDETYNLTVTVAPRLGANLSLAGALANPAAGVMIFVVQKLFQKQMANLIHYKYQVTGDWSDPRVEAVERQGPGRESREAFRP